MERYFNTAGPNRADMQYTIDPLSRLDLGDVLTLIRQQKYFVLHAPRQTGKTSCMLALRNKLNAEGDFIAIYANIEGGQAARNDVKAVVDATCSVIANEVRLTLKDDSALDINKALKDFDYAAKLSTFLQMLSEALPKPLVLILDEIDALVGDSLISVLRQIRSGYANRPQAFPSTIILCGVRDVRDYRIHTADGKEIVTGGSAFNIKAKSLHLGNFSKEEIHELYMQHTRETGQQWDDDCFPRVWEATEGQPWLVNALAHEVTYEMKENRDRHVTITPEMIYQAQERIIYRRDTHIDILIDKLREARVKRVIEPILANEEEPDESSMHADDIQYVTDMGLITRDRGKPIRMANGIYREVIPRELTWNTQQTLIQQPQWYQHPDGSIDMPKLLTEFQQFFRENSDSWIEKFDYKEAGPQLLLQAFLQRIVNGGGYIDREYGLGRRRTDLLIRKPLTSSYGGPVQRIVLELKVRRAKDSLDSIINKGIEQTADYIDSAGQVSEGHLIVFDRDSSKTWNERIWTRRERYRGHDISIWGM